MNLQPLNLSEPDPRVLVTEEEKKMPYFEFIGEDASRKTERAEKYWEVTQVGKTVTVRFGKIGADGQLKVKEFESKEDAEAEVAKLIKEKTKKGYIEKPSPHA
jgi:predicted DNA-binding WGR domain protein